ncbi:hypothetical protein, partial [Vibrio azureus]
DLLERIEIAKKHAYEYAKEIDQNWIGGKGEKGLQPAQGAKKPKMVSVIVTKDRQIFKAYNTRRGNPHFEPHPLVHVDDRVKNAYDNLDEELKKRPTHGMCAEVYTTHKTLSAEADLDGAVSVAVHLDDFTFRDACESCFPAIKSFGIFDGIKME